MRPLAIIPARYGSTRLEGKPLVDIIGKPMIQRVYEQTHKAIKDVFVATDDDRIKQAVLEFGGNVVMTRADHENGTTRCLEAAQKVSETLGEQFDVIVNVQGDEPLLEPKQLHDLLRPFSNERTELATLVIPVSTVEDLFNESEVFVVFDIHGRAIYFSREVIPHIRGVHKMHWLEHHTYYKHVGLYAYTPQALERFASLPMTNLERLESLEQNRWIENGLPIHVGITEHESMPVDTVDDLEKVRAIVRESLNK